MGAYAAIIAGALKLVNYVAAALQQHHDEISGVNKERAATNAQAAQVNANVAKQAVSDSDAAALERLRNGLG